MPFDFAQGRESLDHARDLELAERPVERPFHDLRTNGGDLKRDPHTPFSMLQRGTLNLIRYSRYVKTITYTNKKVEFDLFWTAMSADKVLHYLD